MSEGVERQTSVRHSQGLRHLIDAARPYVPRPDGMTTTVNEFFEKAAGLLATKILSDIGILDDIRKRYESLFGPLPVYDPALLEGGEPNGQEVLAVDPLLQKIKEEIEEGEDLSGATELADE